VLIPVSSPEGIPSPERCWPDRDWLRIACGHKAADMEDRWHAYVEGERLYLHRSWTGRGIYEAGFVREALGWHISDAVVEGDRRFYRRRDDAGETALLAALIDAVLLTERAGPRY
jgi:hypothetical protein